MMAKRLEKGNARGAETQTQRDGTGEMASPRAVAAIAAPAAASLAELVGQVRVFKREQLDGAPQRVLGLVRQPGARCDLI